MNYLDEHNFIDEGDERHVRYDTVNVKKFLNFETFAKLTGSCVEDLQKLNPSIQRNAIPETGRAFTFFVPQTAKEVLMLNRYAILDSASKVGKKELELLAKTMAGSTYGRERIVYKVKSGDVLGSIAIRHGVKVADLKKWNNLKTNTIRTGQRLNIWSKQSTQSSAVATKKAQPLKTNAVSASLKGGRTYVVQPGDTLWDITQKFDGLTIDKIKKLNKLTNNKIQPGQKLVVGI
jgi:membrane-bound lytic murein transglycosylase D